jgi:uncharacterized protein (TIGR02594 family)
MYILVLPFESHPPEVPTDDANHQPQIEESEMKKGKTGQAVALAAALLGTTFLVPPNEAQARPYDGASSQRSYEQRTTVRKPAVKKRAHAKKRVKKNRQYTNNRRHIRQSSARSRAATRNRAVIRVRQSPRIEQIQRASLPQCGFLEFASDCTYDSRHYANSNSAQPQHNAVQRPRAQAASVSSWNRTNHMRKANSMVGMHARANRRDLKKIFAISLNKPVDPVRTPWCAAWANAVLQSSGIRGTNSLLARSFLGWGAATSSPREGDVVVMTRGRGRLSGHVGFFVERQTINGRSYVKVLGGNQGKQVSMAWYPESRVLGYRRVS